jgi:hypothetical protein
LIIFLGKLLIITLYVYLLYNLSLYFLNILNEECLELKSKLDNIKALNIISENIQKDYSYVNSFKTNYNFELKTINNILNIKPNAPNYGPYNNRNLYN